MLDRLRNPWSDHRAELTLGAVSLLVCASVIAMIVFVFARAWPIFAHNGLSWLGPGGSLKTQLANMQATSVNPPASAYHLRAWPLIYGTIADAPASRSCWAWSIAVLSSIFIVELAPARLRRVAIPVIRLLASVPSVIYGLIAILVLVPFVGNHLITAAQKTSVQNSVELTGEGLLVVAVTLTVMITPIMIALICEALTAAPRSWREGAVALGLNPLRAMLAVTLRAIRPAIVAAAVLATARALGEAVMISDGLRRELLHAEPLARGADLPLRAAAHAGLGDHRLQRRHRRPGAATRRCTRSRRCCCSPRSCCRSAGYLIKLPLRKYQVRG